MNNAQPTDGVLYLGDNRMLDTESVRQLRDVSPIKPQYVQWDDEGNLRLVEASITRGKNEPPIDVSARKVTLANGTQVVASGKCPLGREDELRSKMTNAIREAIAAPIPTQPERDPFAGIPGS